MKASLKTPSDTLPFPHDDALKHLQAETAAKEKAEIAKAETLK
jgi:hypothetical protein